MRTLNRQDQKTLRVYLPTDKQSKASIRGFWRGSNGLSYDYIRQTRVSPEDLDSLRKQNSQECLFYTRQGRAYIWYNPNRIEELKHYRYFEYTRQTRGLKAFLKNILKIYGGFTIYIKDEQYLVEVWI